MLGKLMHDGGWVSLDLRGLQNLLCPHFNVPATLLSSRTFSVLCELPELGNMHLGARVDVVLSLSLHHSGVTLSSPRRT